MKIPILESDFIFTWVFCHWNMVGNINWKLLNGSIKVYLPMELKYASTKEIQLPLVEFQEMLMMIQLLQMTNWMELLLPEIGSQLQKIVIQLAKIDAWMLLMES